MELHCASGMRLSVSALKWLIIEYVTALKLTHTQSSHNEELLL